MGDLKAANASGLAWTDVQKAPYDSSYQPVMALAQNHVHFLNVPGTPAGDAQIFVIHCESKITLFTSFLTFFFQTISHIASLTSLFPCERPFSLSIFLLQSRSSNLKLRRTLCLMARLSLRHMAKFLPSSRSRASSKNSHSFPMMAQPPTSSTLRPTQPSPWPAQPTKMPRRRMLLASPPSFSSTALVP